jgi:hypothetical protein
VIGVEASEFIYDKVNEKFEPEIQNHTFKLFQLANADEDNREISFFKRRQSRWGTIMQAFHKQKHLLGDPSIERKLKAIRLDTLLHNEMDEKDELEYLKIEIEGGDAVIFKNTASCRWPASIF